MRDYFRRYLKAGMVALYICLFFLAGKAAEAKTLEQNPETIHWIWPSNGTITDLFGTRKGIHKGIDIASEMGTPIFAVDEGIVSKSYYSDSYGNVVFIKHKNQFETVYAHLKTRNVTEGNLVKQGEMIGKMGDTGDSSGVHLHFEIHHDEWTFDKHNAIDPILAFEPVEIGRFVMARKVNGTKAVEVSGNANTVN